MSNRKNRSDQYQYKYAELSYTTEMMGEFSQSQGLHDFYRPQDKEALLDLKQELFSELWKLIDIHLTERQAEVIHLSADGYTQIEIAKILGVNQSSVTKSLNGNCDYRKDRRTYGGAKKRLRKLVNDDPVIKGILKKIADIHEDYV